MLICDQIVFGSQRLAGLIACLGLCMLTAAWGALVGPAWHRLWAIFGAFGLVSAIGLDVLAKSRLRSLIQEQEEKTGLRLEQNLNRLISGVQATDAIRAAVERIIECASDGESQSCRLGETSRLPLQMQVRITPILRLPGSTGERLGASFTGHARDISSRGIGLMHDCCLEGGSMLVDFELDNDEHIQFVADLLWCTRQDDGWYLSGGKLMKLLTSDDGPSSELCSEELNERQASSFDDEPASRVNLPLGGRVRVKIDDIGEFVGTALARHGLDRLRISVESEQHDVYLDVPEDTVELVG